MMTDVSTLAIRPARPEDAGALAQLISAFNAEEGSPGQVTATDVAHLCFGTAPPYWAIVADDGGHIAGYVLAMRFFDTEPCTWCSYLQDLYVAPARRSRNIGRRLLAAAARQAIAAGHPTLSWHVRAGNRRGRSFYAATGAREQAMIPVTLIGDALTALAAEAP